MSRAPKLDPAIPRNGHLDLDDWTPPKLSFWKSYGVGASLAAGVACAALATVALRSGHVSDPAMARAAFTIAGHHLRPFLGLWAGAAGAGTALIWSLGEHFGNRTRRARIGDLDRLVPALDRVNGRRNPSRTVGSGGGFGSATPRTGWWSSRQAEGLSNGIRQAASSRYSARNQLESVTWHGLTVELSRTAADRRRWSARSL